MVCGCACRTLQQTGHMVNLHTGGGGRLMSSSYSHLCEGSKYAESVYRLCAQTLRMPTHVALPDASCMLQEEAVTQVPLKRPDGDTELENAGHNFTVPNCPQCGGILKPGVVFFGGSVPAVVANQATQLAAECDAILIAGSSISTFSVFRLVRAAKDAGKPVAAINIGSMRADPLLSFKVPHLAGEVMMRLATHPSLLVPRSG